MPSRVLLIYWNDLAFPEEVSSDELRDSPIWKERALAAFRALQQVMKTRPDCKVSFSKGAFYHHVGDRPFQNWLELWLGKDAFRRLRGSVVQPIDFGEPEGHALDCELRCFGRPGDGITRAHLSSTWAWSFGSRAMGCDETQIFAEKISIDQDGATPVEVSNLAEIAHVVHWQESLETWGKDVSQNHVVCQVNGYQVIMYPLDHGYPHIHVKAHNDPKVNVKYRIDDFAPLTYDRPQGLDAQFRAWVEQHREDLMTSWQRCKRGQFPLKL